MFDARLRPWIDPPLNAAGRWVAARGFGPDSVTLVGMFLGLASGAAIACEAFLLGLALIVGNRLIDGLDGAVARVTRPSDFGGYLDIVADFAFYVAVPVGFGIADPNNLLPALLLVSSFALTGVSFLAFAVLAGKRGLETDAHGKKSFFYNSGLAEGGETIAAFVLMTLLPGRFGLIAGVYSCLCIATVVQRSLVARHRFKGL